MLIILLMLYLFHGHERYPIQPIPPPIVQPAP